MMSKSSRRRRQPVEVKTMFEPTRLATEHLIEAYLSVVPLRRRTTTPMSRSEASEDADLIRPKSKRG